ncbi:MAG: Carboxyl-terminal protease [Microgenomates group bacterium GW2011_GWF2_47_9]|nr:MAG: Carboxyl-terminal protease [Microgenomates group bacterium GW2011_GWF2_47_9]
MKAKLTYRILRNFFLSIGVGLLFFAGGYNFAKVKYVGGSNSATIRRFVENPQTKMAEGADFSKFWEVWQRLEESFVEPELIDYREMTWGSMKGLASSLGDPYTQYLPPAQNKTANEDLNGSFYGVGIELGYKDQTLAVISPLKNSPADLAGIKAGDLILNIKDDKKGLDVETRGMTLPEAVTNIRGEKGTEVVLTLYREGIVEPFDTMIVRGEIVVPSVEVEYLSESGKKIARLSLHKFGGRTDKEWAEKVGEILANKVDGVILDLRNNPGGYLDGAAYVSGEFLPFGETVVEQRGRVGNEVKKVDRRGSLTTIPLVVLVNKGSASASEITAGALKDHGRAKIVGETTFGKGTVQEVQDLSDGSSLHVTIAKWMTPNGNWIDKEGIKPDVEVQDDIKTEDVDEQLVKALGLFN